MIFNLEDNKEATIASQLFNKLILDKRLIELKQVKETRSSLQNRSLHLFFTMISVELRNLGQEFPSVKLSKWKNKLFEDDDIMFSKYTPFIVKNFVWRPIQITLFNIESTKDINSKQLNEIAEVIIKFFAEKGISLIFPNIQSLIHGSETN